MLTATRQRGYRPFGRATPRFRALAGMKTSETPTCFRYRMHAMCRWRVGAISQASSPGTGLTRHSRQRRSRYSARSADGEHRWRQLASSLTMRARGCRLSGDSNRKQQSAGTGHTVDADSRPSLGTGRHGLAIERLTTVRRMVSNHLQTQVPQILEGLVVKGGRSGRILAVARRDEDCHSLTGACQQYSVGVLQVSPVRRYGCSSICCRRNHDYSTPLHPCGRRRPRLRTPSPVRDPALEIQSRSLRGRSWIARPVDLPGNSGWVIEIGPPLLLAHEQRGFGPAPGALRLIENDNAVDRRSRVAKSLITEVVDVLDEGLDGLGCIDLGDGLSCAPATHHVVAGQRQARP